MHYRTLVSVDDLARTGLPPDWVLIDCRFDLADSAWGEAAYRESHIPGAFYAHLERDLSGPVTQGTGRHPLPPWPLFAERLGRWGIHPQTQVVVYDRHHGACACRLWWMLRALGHENVALLDGGWGAWLDSGGATEAGLPGLRAVNFIIRPGSGWITTSQVEQNLSTNQLLLVDARSVERFRGEQEPIDPVAGHVPGAINRPYTDNLVDGTLFLPSNELRGQWEALLGGRAPETVVHMCGSGVTACHNMLAMEIAGLGGSALYVGSWSEWITDRRRPVAGVRR